MLKGTEARTWGEKIEVLQCESKPLKFFSCKVIDIHVYQVLGQRIPQNGHFEPTKNLYHDHIPN